MRRKIENGEIDLKERGKKISLAKKGMKVSDETKEKLRQINLGKTYSLESRLKKSKAILQYDLNNNFVREWWSIREAGRTLNISIGAISNCCKYRQKTARGFKWKYNNEDIV